MSNANQFRHNGRFARKSIIKWKKNISESMKKIHLKYKNCGVQMPNGRRIVDFDMLAKDMWCRICDLPLSFRNLVKEDIIGIASVFHLKCQKCERIRVVRSSGNEENRSIRSKYHVNFKLALAILDGGIGETQLNTILSALNVPTVNHNLIKRYERLVGPAIETVARESCHKALKVERELTIANEGYIDTDEEASVENIHEAGDLEEGLQCQIDITTNNYSRVETDANIRLETNSCIDNNMIQQKNFDIETDIRQDCNNNVVVRSVENGIQNKHNSEDTKANSQKMSNKKRKLQSIGSTDKNRKKRKVGLRVSYDGAWLKKGSGKVLTNVLELLLG